MKSFVLALLLSVVASAPTEDKSKAPAAVETKVHLTGIPVVVGHTAQVLKPVLASPILVPAEVEKIDEKKEVVQVVHPLPYVSPFVYGAPAIIDLKAPIPAGEAPPMDELVMKSKVQTPVRTQSEVIPEVTVHHPAKVNVEKVAVEVPIAHPYFHPVPVPVVPQVAVHHVAPAIVHL